MRFGNVACCFHMHHGTVESQRLEHRQRLQLAPRRRFEVKGAAAPAKNQPASVRMPDRQSGQFQKIKFFSDASVDRNGDVGMDRIGQHENAPC
jgi:hypothetical protein